MKTFFIVILVIIILFATIIDYSKWNWRKQIHKEMSKILNQGKATERIVITEQMLEPLPLPVQKWLINSGMVGKERIDTVYLKQRGLMRLKPEQKEWIKAEAEQYIITAKPAFLWQVAMPIMPCVNVVGRDLLMDGQAELLIRVASTVSVAKAANNEKTNISSLQRYLLELSWYPSAALSPYITWQPIDDQSAKATITHGGNSGSAIFQFNKAGELIQCSAYRYKDNDAVAQPKECIATIKENRVISGIKIPTKIDISWILDEGLFTWYKLEVINIEYNRVDMETDPY